MLRKKKHLEPRRTVYSQDMTPASATVDGGVYLAEGRVVYKVRGGVYEFISDKAFESWGLGEPVVLAGPTPAIAGVLGFREGTLLSRFSNGNLYIVSRNTTRHVTGPDVLFTYGLSHRPIIQVSEQEFSVHEEGEPIDA